MNGSRRARDAGASPPRAVAKRPEKAIQRAVLDFLAKVPGVVAWKSGAGSFRLSYKGRERFVRMGKRGVSDIIGYRIMREWSQVTTCALDGHVGHASMAMPGPVARFLAIEVKQAGKKPDADQQAFLDAVAAAGGLAFVARSVDDVAAALGLAAAPRAKRGDSPAPAARATSPGRAPRETSRGERTVGGA